MELCIPRLAKAVKSKSETKIFYILMFGYHAFNHIYFETRFLFNELACACHYLTCSFTASDKDNASISLSGKMQPSSFQLLVQFIKNDITEQCTQRSLLCDKIIIPLTRNFLIRDTISPFLTSLITKVVSLS